MIIAPGPKTRVFHDMVTREIHRLSYREDYLDDLINHSPKAFVVMLATEQAARIAERRDTLLRMKRPGRRGPRRTM